MAGGGYSPHPHYRIVLNFSCRDEDYPIRKRRRSGHGRQCSVRNVLEGAGRAAVIPGFEARTVPPPRGPAPQIGAVGTLRTRYERLSRKQRHILSPPARVFRALGETIYQPHHPVLRKVGRRGGQPAGGSPASPGTGMRRSAVSAATAGTTGSVSPAGKGAPRSTSGGPVGSLARPVARPAGRHHDLLFQATG